MTFGNKKSKIKLPYINVIIYSQCRLYNINFILQERKKERALLNPNGHGKMNAYALENRNELLKKYVSH